MHSSAHKMLRIAKVLKSNGTEGDVMISFIGISPEDIDIEGPVFIYFDGLPVPFYFESFTRKASNKAIVRLTGIRTLEDADEIAGMDIFTDDSSIAGEDEGDFSFLAGWTLEDEDGNVIGKVAGFLDIPNNPCLEITAGDKEVIVPLHEDLILSADQEMQVIRMSIPDGLFS